MSATHQASSAPSNKTQPRDTDEPEITQEESVPSDGKDEVGEKMMEDLGRDKQEKGEGDRSKGA